MEIFSCSGNQYADESDCTEHSSRSSFIYDGASDFFEHEKQLQTQTDNESENIDKSYNAVVSVPPSHLTANTTVDSIPQNFTKDEESSLLQPKWLERDESVALWVKWRGIWQAGIRCAKADWPLSTLRAKPTHDRKKYFVIFFPHTRNYSWADMLLVRPINEFPEPIAYKTHKIGLKMVKDLTIARRHIMQKLAVGMLNVVDQFHTLALTETARDVTVWKEFAMESSRCCDYSDLGRMILKLQSMILPKYINAEWSEHSSHSWVQQCHNALTAGTIELLKEELHESILWSEINPLWDSPVQPTSGSEWKTWKNEVMKWFSTSHPISSGRDHHEDDSFSNPTHNISRKRAKLEVRRADTHSSQVVVTQRPQPMTLEIESNFLNCVDTINNVEIVSEPRKLGLELENSTTRTPQSMSDNLDNIVVDAGSSESNKHNERTPLNSLTANGLLNPRNKPRQCIAFIESKGRHCVRWANDNDVYCCIHLVSRVSGGKSTKTVGSPSVYTPMCEGITVHGTNCKHRAIPGSSVCKKHRPRGNSNTTPSPETTLKRKREPILPTSRNNDCRDIVIAGKAESPLCVDPISVVEVPQCYNNGMEVPQCLGSYSSNSSYDPCHESQKPQSLYCDKHLPGWLKRARNGKSRIVTKEVFLELLKDCRSLEEKLQLHQACEIFYKFFKNITSLRSPVPMEVQLQWALSEASKDSSIGELLMKLVCSEKSRLLSLWDFTRDEDANISKESPTESLTNSLCDNDTTIRCKICLTEFDNDQQLGTHWMEKHKNEVLSQFKGYVCAICLDSFSDKDFLESHIQERHHVQFVENCMLLHCTPCGSHFEDTEQLRLHMLSVHPVDFRMPKVPRQHNVFAGEKSIPLVADKRDALSDFQKFVCKFCGLKFDSLPDLGRHHQTAHIAPSLASSRPSKRGVRYYAYRLKSGRLSHPRLKHGLTTASYRIRNKASSIKKLLHVSKSIGVTLGVQSGLTEAASLGKLAESQCSGLAKILFPYIRKTNPRPNNHDILSVARSACCKLNLKASLESKYGVLPERMYLKAAKLCSEHDIKILWHQDGFICPNGCKHLKDPNLLSSPLMPRIIMAKQSKESRDHVKTEWEMDECHEIVDSRHFRRRPVGTMTVLCKDMSFGRESVVVSCVVDEGLSENGGHDMPWENYNYVTKSLIDQSINIVNESLQRGCACSNSVCSPETCDHVYHFDNDFERAKDMFGKTMRNRFPYDKKGRIILDEGYLVYECNQMCRCNNTCQNRILQNGVRMKLEVFKTENKGWGVRAGETILRGMFICEYVGEVIDEDEASKRRNRYGREGCGYMYYIDGRVNDISRLTEGRERYVIDATTRGNVSRFINHSCSPNLMTYQVLVESMDCERSHIGLYASRDIAEGEELTCDYRYELLPGEGCPCLCGASNCKGRLY